MIEELPARDTGCRQARRCLFERGLAALPDTLEAALEHHLESCAACRGEAALDSQLDEDLARLRTPLPFAVEVRARTMELVAQSPRPLGWRALAGWRAILAAAALPAALLALSLSLLPGAGAGLWSLRELLAPLGALPGLGRAAARALAGLGSSAWPLILSALEGLGGFLRWAAPSSALALGLVVMAATGTMTFLILRDFLTAPAIHVGKE